MRCADCWFLHNKIQAGRNPQSCADLGEESSNEACSSFRPRGQVPNLPLAPTEIQLDPDKPVDFVWSDAFNTVYREQMQIERDLFQTTEKIRTEFFLDQKDGEVDQSFERYAQKLADLRLLHVLCGLFECDIYRDTIMASEIERQFGVKPPPQAVQAIQKATKDTAYADLRVPSIASIRAQMDREARRRAKRKAKRKARRGAASAVDSFDGTTEES